jgi:uncharacterized protein (TIGR03435 family)
MTRLVLAAALASYLFAQSPDTFEAAIVRPSGPDSVFQSTVTASQFTARRHTLAMMVAESYPDIESWRLSGGPSWVRNDMWDLVAKLPAGSPTDQERLYRVTEQMLRTFLAEDFKLKTHFEQREQPIYDLVFAKSNPKLKPSDTAERSFRFTPTGVEIHHETMQEFVMFLYCPNCARQTADRPVFDKTGLTGYYDFTLNWSPLNIASDAVASGPSIFTALEEQLGLKLQPRKAPVDFLIIDQAERPEQN